MFWALVVNSFTNVQDGGAVVDTRMRFNDQAHCISAAAAVRASRWLSRYPTHAFCTQMSKTQFGSPRQALQSELMQVLRQMPQD